MNNDFHNNFRINGVSNCCRRSYECTERWRLVFRRRRWRRCAKQAWTNGSAIDGVQPMDDGGGRRRLLKREPFRRRPSLDVAPPPPPPPPPWRFMTPARRGGTEGRSGDDEKDQIWRRQGVALPLLLILQLSHRRYRLHGNIHSSVVVSLWIHHIHYIWKYLQQ